jgi:hypothetical protein
MAKTDVTARLADWNRGDRAALDELLPLIYKELRGSRAAICGKSVQIIRYKLALVHEAYLQLVDQTKVNWQNRAHFSGLRPV